MRVFGNFGHSFAQEEEREGAWQTKPSYTMGGGPRVTATSPPLNLTIPNQDQGPTINQGPKPDFRAGHAFNS